MLYVCIVVMALAYGRSVAQSPHGKNLQVSCDACHTTASWQINPDSLSFDHKTTGFALDGQHGTVDCRSCHTSLEFDRAVNNCATCHLDVHQNTVGDACERCHDVNSWLVSNIAEVHRQISFPLLGAHAVANCAACHQSETDLRFGPMDTDCFSCHQQDYASTTNPNHQQAGFSTDCSQCHKYDAYTWDANDINHDFFPLTAGHEINDCARCHMSQDFSMTSPDCFSCHEQDYLTSANPNHQTLGLSTSCIDCHTTNPDWNPATFDVHNDFYPLNGAHAMIANDCARCHHGDYNNTPSTCVGCHLEDFNQTTNPSHTELGFSTDCIMCHNENAWEPSTFDHDGQYFPIYNGKHEGEWNACVDCHTTPGNFGEFTCITCHSNPDTDDEHEGVSGYQYNSPACLACHPTGEANGAFDHNNTDFPLTGVHLTIDCFECHAAGFEGTPTACAACHATHFNEAANPNHNALGFSMDCATCHTTDPGWSPATLDNHNDYYVLNGAHAVVSNDCASCHNGDYINTPNTCAGCHTDDYNQTVDPPHLALMFSNDCASCHNENAWVPSTFDHDGQHFPIYSGAHAGVWAQCSECHTTPGNFMLFTCVTCHMNPETDEIHASVGGYAYSSQACLACHPTGEGDVIFDHNMTGFPLTGGHMGPTCIDCHSAGYEGTSAECNTCHMLDYNQSVNPNHMALGLQTDCASCHTTDPGWAPASFAMHNDYYVLNGAHALVSNQCATCHNGDYNNTPNTCAGCHTADYNQTVDPPHLALQFSTDCASCHSETAWEPSTFDHDGQYFPIYSGAHAGVWAQCSECHTTPGNYMLFTCITCHANPETDEEHAGVGGYIYSSTACLACHPTGEGDITFDHNTTGFPLTGGHMGPTCIDCHAAGYEGTSPECNMCHLDDFNQSLNPNHMALGISTDCASCHTTDPGWAPASFGVHNDYYVLNGAHALISNQCATCHNGDYNNTPNTCAGCHTEDYNQTTDPPHLALQFSTDCASCHSESAWSPSTFEHDAQYFPIYSGSHQGVWSQCSECHHVPGNYAAFTCVTCHTQPETNEDHTGVNGYVYESSACLACHPNGEGDFGFDHNSTAFPLTGAHTMVNCLDCHAAGYEGTPTECAACHTTDFNQSTNPNHVALSIPNDCVMCHTTNPDWTPAAFPIHDNYYPLAGAHALIADQCVTCHNGNYNNTPNTCAGCHQSDYNNTNNPSHIALNFSNDCATCHNETGWSPAEYADHDDQFFPIYSGDHDGVWSQCTECHTNPNNYSVFTCVTCHTSGETGQQHAGVNGYVYESTACLACHPDGSAEGSFDHNQSGFPLTGAHLSVSCVECHSNGYQNTPTECSACHTPDYNSASNPNHQSLGLSMDCVTCHTTAPDWNPALFPNHNDFYPLLGAHAAIADQCVTCHNGNYNNTPNTCFGCHQAEYNNTNNPDHQAAQFPTTCETCHNQNSWVPSTWDHDDLYFPIYSGKHEDEWNQCNDCHTNPNNYSVFTCITCHEQNETDEEHDEVGGYQYNSNACLACHPDGED